MSSMNRVSSPYLTLMLASHVALGSMLTFFSVTAYADQVRCNGRQTYCVTKDPRLTIGDKVAVFNRNDEVVAVGEVDHLSGAERRFELKERFGLVRRADVVKIIAANDAAGLGKMYRLYREPAKVTVAGEVGVAKLGIGEGAPALLVSGFYEKDLWRGVQWTGRGLFLRATGNASGQEVGRTDADATVMSLGALPGISYTLRENQDLSFRGEANLGFTYSMTSVAGEGSYSDYVRNLEPGFGLASQVQAAVLYRYQEWRPGLAFTTARIQNASMPAFSLTLAKKLK